MVISGLNNNRYLINNPIWVEITGAGAKVTLTFTSFSQEVGEQNYFFTFYTLNGRTIFDLSEIIKSLMPEPNHPQNPIAGSFISGNSLNVGLTFQSGASSQTLPKMFFRGGRDSMGTNIFLTANSVLKESEKIPVWQGFPSAKYSLNSNNQVIYSNILANNEIERRKVVTCNPVFLRFLNSKGGYSYWLFEEWEMNKKTTKTERIDRRFNPLDLGLESTHKLSMTTRVEQRYNATLNALLQSPEIWVYNISSLMPEQPPGFPASNLLWTRIYNAGGDMRWNAFERVNEYSFDFDLLFKQKPVLKW